MIKSVLEALAVGDAMGMPTEFMTQEDIDRVFPHIRGLQDPARSYTHPGLPFASVTDDTQQNLYLARAYVRAGKITVENSAQALSDWIVECDAVEKKYIGPSSLRALDAIARGISPYEAGKEGVTNGGIMRTPALVLCAGRCDEAQLFERIRMGCLPTHNTSQALEAAAAYGFALRTALDGGETEDILAAAKRGARMGLAGAEWVAAAPGCVARLEKIVGDLACDGSDGALRHLLYHVYGTGLASVDAFAASMAVFLQKGRDVFGALCLCAGLGGDTDTIGALTGALCAAYARGHNIPDDVLRRVEQANGLDLAADAAAIESAFWQ